jgi:hypothetical protein
MPGGRLAERAWSRTQVLRFGERCPLCADGLLQSLACEQRSRPEPDSSGGGVRSGDEVAGGGEQVAGSHGRRSRILAVRLRLAVISWAWSPVWGWWAPRLTCLDCVGEAAAESVEPGEDLGALAGVPVHGQGRQGSEPPGGSDSRAVMTG